MPDYSHLLQSLLNWSVPATPVRAALREFYQRMVEDDPGATSGVRGLGVFYTHQTKERFVIRDGVVWKVPSRRVVKLRPPKAAAIELEESPDVAVSFQTTGAVNDTYRFKSSDRDGQFVCTAPTELVDDVWNLTYNCWKGQPSYVFGNSDMSQSEIDNLDSWYSGAGASVLALRIEHSLTTVWHRVSPGTLVVGLIEWSAECDDGIVRSLLDVSGDNEVSAHVRARALHP